MNSPKKSVVKQKCSSKVYGKLKMATIDKVRFQISKHPKMVSVPTVYAR